MKSIITCRHQKAPQLPNSCLEAIANCSENRIDEPIKYFQIAVKKIQDK